MNGNEFKICLIGCGGMTQTVHELIEEYTIFKANGFYQESRSFFDLPRGGERLISDVATGASTVDVMQCIRERITDYTK